MGTLVEHLAEVGDPRTGNFIPHKLQEILVIAICAILAGAESFVEMVEWAQAKEAWLRRFLLLKHGIPSHDTVNRVFRLIDPGQFETAFRTWTSSLLGATSPSTASACADRGWATRADSHGECFRHGAWSGAGAGEGGG